MSSFTEVDELATVLKPAGAYDFWPQKAAEFALAAGYRKPRTITTPFKLESLRIGSAVQTSDESDTVVLKSGKSMFRNQDGYELSATDLWRYGTHPFTVIYEPEAAK